MKYLLSFLLSLVLFLPIAAQTIGLKCNTAFSSLEQSEYETGAAVFVGINDFSEKVEVLFSVDFNKSNTVIKDGKERSYTRTFFNATGLYVLPIAEKLKFKTGISITHENIHMTQRGAVSNWIQDYYSKYLGVGIASNLQFQKIFKLPLNFDVFVTPSWLKNIHVEREPFKSNYKNANYLFVLNVQLGVAYVIDMGK